ncbi:MAG: DUF1553 domain-containing protein [Phycisphaera sp. RhM]|nr:DUF1553 domain-containing protein [Phycisphaera sp. RhM]
MYPLRFLLIVVAMCGGLSQSGVVAEDAVDFQRDIRPLLSDRCFACHGPDEETRQADLRLDQRSVAVGTGAIVPGTVDESELIRRIFSSDPDQVMPPPAFNKDLTDAQKESLRRWIEQGAEYQVHWSFAAPRRPDVPVIGDVSNPIDAFLQQRLKDEGVSPAKLAERETLIRRVTLDLTGLPPTPEEVDAFLADTSSDAWDKLVDALMSRQTYGEHMARYWLDLARYADTHGLHLDNERSMWPYRDWVVRAFNQNLPFDEFTRWQLAGDLLPEPTPDQLIASGFNRCNVTTSEGGSINEEWVYRYAVDRTSTAVEVWMGLTAGCAVCHDHKFDPLTTKEYYSLYAFFHSAADPAMDGNVIDTPPILRLVSDEDRERAVRLDTMIAAVDQRIAAAVAEIDYVDPATLDPPPTPETVETVWFEDGFPPGVDPKSSGGPPLKLVSQDQGPVFSGQRALTRTSDNAVSQDFFQGGATFTIPNGGKFSIHCFLDADDPPEAIMVQFHAGGWKHRAVWGDNAKIPFGKDGTTEKVSMGELPRAGQWTKLEFDAAKVGLKPGSNVDGFAFTQFSGTVTWDHLSITTTVDTANDPSWSWQAWKRQKQGKRNNELPEGLRQLVRGKRAEQWTDAETQQINDFWLANVYAGAREKLDPIKAEKLPLEKEKSEIEKQAPLTFVMADLPKPRESFVMRRGQYDNPGEKVTRGVPSFLPPLPAKPNDRDYNRLDLANWLLSPDHPMTARVAVNRLWQQFFGIGIVKTSADFGSQGEPPSHPRLLDWLAVEFIEDGWDVKRFIKRIVTSHAYRQSSAASPQWLERDPENRLLGRGPRHRLDAEILRDQALYLSGLLVPTIGGKGVRPYQPPNIWEPVGFGSSNTRYYKQDSGDALYRRSLYTFLKRTAPPPFMSSFDAPNREQSCTVRGRSNTPLQALQLMNDIQHVEAARNFAQRILDAEDSKDADRIRRAWRIVTARQPDAEEVRITLESLNRHRDRYRGDADAATQLITYGESPADASIDPSELAAWTLVANLLLNLDEVINKN